MEIKSWWKSKTVWSDILTLIMAILPAIDNVYGTHITTNPAYSTGLALLAAMGIHGRVTADSVIK